VCACSEAPPSVHKKRAFLAMRDENSSDNLPPPALTLEEAKAAVSAVRSKSALCTDPPRAAPWPRKPRSTLLSAHVLGPSAEQQQPAAEQQLVAEQHVVLATPAAPAVDDPITQAGLCGVGGRARARVSPP
jgi:hypothetical protein